jgi:bla regulator protein BlaR1
MRTLRWTVVCLTVFLSYAARPQTEPRPQFEVASIKPAALDARGMFVGPGPGGGISMSDVSLKQLIAIAWRVQAFQISGGPLWVDSVHYDVVGKPEAEPKEGEILPMLQSLLKDRFQLTFHRATKELLIYSLVLARKDSKLGPRLTKSKDGDCTPPDPSTRRPQTGKPACEQMTINANRMTAVSLPIANLTLMLSRRLGRTIVDKTGLTGNFNMSLEWASVETRATLLPMDAPAAQAPDPAEPSIFTALQEQLGLKLESQNGPVETLIIERAEKPSEN